MNHTCLCLLSRSWYSFTNLRGMEGWVCPVVQACSCDSLSQNFHFCCFSAMAYTRLWNWMQFCNLTNDRRLLLDLYSSINVCMWLAYLQNFIHIKLPRRSYDVMSVSWDSLIVWQAIHYKRSRSKVKVTAWRAVSEVKTFRQELWVGGLRIDWARFNVPPNTL